MPKRKAVSDSEEEAQSSDESSDNKPKRKLRAKKAVNKGVRPELPQGADPSDIHSDDRTFSRDTTIQRNSEGDKYIELGKKKRATVRSFKNIPLLDIREFYSAGSEDKPGKKGISLSLEQWQVLKANSAAIDDLFAELGKGNK